MSFMIVTPIDEDGIEQAETWIPGTNIILFHEMPEDHPANLHIKLSDGSWMYVADELNCFLDRFPHPSPPRVNVYGHGSFRSR